jgi:hypothetical protein
MARGETRTRSLRFRRPTPYPLGHTGYDFVDPIINYPHSSVITSLDLDYRNNFFFKQILVHIEIV